LVNLFELYDDARTCERQICKRRFHASQELEHMRE